jgi:hypothetical protein
MEKEERLRKKKVWAESRTKSKKVSVDKAVFEVVTEEKMKGAENLRNEIGGWKEYKKLKDAKKNWRHVVREPVGLANTRVTEKTRRVILYRLVSKLDDHGPWNNEIPLLDKENKEDKSLFPSMTALLIIAKASILCKSGRLTFCCERGEDWLYLASETNIDPNTEQKKEKRRGMDASP